MGLKDFIAALGRRDGLIMAAIASTKNPTNATIARMTGYSVRTVQRSIKALVAEGWLLRGMSGGKRRLAPAPGLLAKRLFDIPRDDLEYLFNKYGRERVSEAIRVLEFTYATSRARPRCPLAILKAVLRRGRLIYPRGYIPRERLNTTQEIVRAFDALPFKEKEARIRRAYAKLFSKTRDHASSLARAEAFAIAEFARERESYPGTLGHTKKRAGLKAG